MKLFMKKNAKFSSAGGSAPRPPKQPPPLRISVYAPGCNIWDIPPILPWHQSSRVYCGQQWPRCGYGRLLLNLLWLLHVLASGIAK